MLETAVVGPLLEAIQSRTGAAGVYFYRFDSATLTAHLSGWAGKEPDSQVVELGQSAMTDHFRRELPIILHHAAWRDPRFTAFPEVTKHRLEGLVSIPLMHNDVTVGMLNVGRTDPAALAASDVAALFGLSLPMGALLTAQEEYKKVSEQLADRKLLDRAKGILQDRLAWTEEQAYLHLRRASRRRRIKIREVAREIIEVGPGVPLEARRAS